MSSLFTGKLIESLCNFPQKILCKVKVPAKIKDFLWLMVRKNYLTNDNLLMSGWAGNKMCIFCGRDETINHLFFQCSVANLVWSLLKCTFSLNSTLTALNDCFGIWIGSFLKNEKKLVLVGVSVVFWSIWRCNNDVIFEEKKLINDPIILIKLICYWINVGLFYR